MDRTDNKPYQEALVDTPFSLYCPVVGSPLPNITWSKVGMPLLSVDGNEGVIFYCGALIQCEFNEVQYFIVIFFQ